MSERRQPPVHPDGQQRDCVRALDILTWLTEIEKLQTKLVSADASVHVDRYLRRAFYLAQLTPDSLWESFGSNFDEISFEEALEKTDYQVVLHAISPQSPAFSAIVKSREAIPAKIGSDVTARLDTAPRFVVRALLTWTRIILGK